MKYCTLFEHLVDSIFIVEVSSSVPTLKAIMSIAGRSQHLSSVGWANKLTNLAQQFQWWNFEFFFNGISIDRSLSFYCTCDPTCL